MAQQLGQGNVVGQDARLATYLPRQGGDMGNTVATGQMPGPPTPEYGAAYQKKLAYERSMMVNARMGGTLPSAADIDPRGGLRQGSPSDMLAMQAQRSGASSWAPLADAAYRAAAPLPSAQDRLATANADYAERRNTPEGTKAFYDATHPEKPAKADNTAFTNSLGTLKALQTALVHSQTMSQAAHGQSRELKPLYDAAHITAADAQYKADLTAYNAHST